LAFLLPFSAYYYYYYYYYYASQSHTKSSPGALRSFCGSAGEAPLPAAASSALQGWRFCFD
jgi:hypothetical protein